MKKYRIILKSDKSKVKLIAYADSPEEAVKIVCNAELCPESAVKKVELLPFYVTMTDKFMSGWGLAENKTNKLIIICETWEQAQTIERNAAKRPEMKYINSTTNRPRYGNHVVESWKTYADLGEIWKQ